MPARERITARGAPGGSRTHTMRVLNPLPLPIWLPGLRCARRSYRLASGADLADEPRLGVVADQVEGADVAPVKLDAEEAGQRLDDERVEQPEHGVQG